MRPTPAHHRQQPLMVVLRVRPMNSGETKAGAKRIAFVQQNKLLVLRDPNDGNDDILRVNRSREKTYVFDRSFDEFATQADVYDATVKAKNMVDRVLNGYNCTVFAYGATGTGKTHTMLGTLKEPGIMMITLNDLYKKIEETNDEMTYRVSMAYVEIYNETVRDLLRGGQVLDLRDDSKGEVTMSGLLDLETHSTADIMALLSRGNQLRTCEPTAANRTSSRSHALLKLSVEQRSKAMNVKQEVRHSVLFMVDLAGSERAAVTKNLGMRMIEGAHINRSLLALANCINALTVSHPTHFINYRDSKLTRLLKDALGGNCMTVMIAHISPASTVFEESRNTLVYADRGKKIKNKTRQNIVDVNYHITEYQNIIDTLNHRVETLQKQLGKQKHNSEVIKLCDLLKSCSNDEKEIRKEILMLEYHLLQNAVECQKHLASIKEWEQSHISLTHLPTVLSSLKISSAGNQEDKHTETDKLPDSGNEESGVEEPFTDSEMPSGNEQSEPLYSRPSSTEDSIKPVIGPHSFLPPLQQTALTEENRATPDSGTCNELEPLWLTGEREEVAVLMADKQRMETEHRKLLARHRENALKIARVRETVFSYPDLHPARKELIEELYHSSQREAASVETSLAATLMCVQLGRHEALIQQLLAHSSALLKVVTALQAAMGKEGVALPEGLNVKELETKHRKLRARVQAEKQMPLLSKTMEIPHLAKLSAKLYTSITGSHSNFPTEEQISDEVDLSQSLSNVQLSTQPSLTSPNRESFLPSLSTVTLTTVPQFIPSFLQLSSSTLTQDIAETMLPPLVDHNIPLTASPLTTDEVRNSTDVAKPLSDSSLHRILQAAETKKIDRKRPSMDRKSTSPSKGVLERVASLTATPKRKYIVSDSSKRTSSGIGQGKPKKLPMDRLASVMKSKQKRDSSLNETAFRIPRPSRRKLKPIRAPSKKQPSQTLEPKGKRSSLADNSLSLLQSNKKLFRAPKASNWSGACRRVHPMATQKMVLSDKLTASPYSSPQRTTTVNQHVSPRRGVGPSKKHPLKTAWK